MKYTVAVVFALMLLPEAAVADDEDTPVTSSVEIHGDQRVGEKHEIEIYDYHTGTYQTVDVYRKPDQTTRQIPETGTENRPSVLAAPR